MTNPFENLKKSKLDPSSLFDPTGLKLQQDNRIDIPEFQMPYDAQAKYSAETRFGGAGGENDLINRSTNVLKARESALGGYNAGELGALRNQLNQGTKARTAQSVRDAQTSQGAYGVSGATGYKQVSDIKQQGRMAEDQSDERLLLMQREAQQGALDKYETDVLGRQLAITAEETAKQQQALTAYGMKVGAETNQPQPTTKSGAMTMLCGACLLQGLIPDDLLASEIIEADKISGAMLHYHTAIGYSLLCGWMVKLTLKHRFFGKIISPIVIFWMRDMAFRFGLKKKGSFLGSIINIYGQKICKFVGGIYGKEKI